uniref:Aminopeptidase N-like N-terminal domain-containing protein n=1 Tax=Mola mola TaxID=94237 RepID=A0A3Q3X6N4_MOLML
IQNSKQNLNIGTQYLFPYHRYIIPLHYNLLLQPNFISLSFKDSVSIQIGGLQVTNATVLNQNHTHLSKQVAALPVLHNPSHEQIGIFSPRVLNSGQKHFLYIEFEAKLTEGFHGFYKSTYRTSTGETRTLAATRFEPTSARRAFPGFDEPNFKASFSIRIRQTPEYISLSNMPGVSTVEVNDGFLEDQFDASMSTYLVAFVICDLKSVHATTSSGVQMSIYASPEKSQQTTYVLEVLVKMLDFYEEYFNIHYPLPKITFKFSLWCILMSCNVRH